MDIQRKVMNIKSVVLKKKKQARISKWKICKVFHNYYSIYTTDNSDYLEALKILEKQKDENLLFVKTNYQLSIDAANKMAKFEEERIQEFYDVSFFHST